MKDLKKIALLLLINCIGIQLCAQEEGQAMVIDQVVAVVGNKMVKISDIEAQAASMKGQGILVDNEKRCEILENMLVNKLYENQAEIDSIIVSESDIEIELDRRMRYFIAEFGSREKLEEFYKKSVLEIKEEFRGLLKDQLTANKMERSITEEVKVTPRDVKNFYRNLDDDSIPLIETEYEIEQLIRIPEITSEEKTATKKRLDDYRNEIINGKRFAAIAASYSEDPGSYRRGGELGFFSRGDMYPEFEAVAYSTKKGDISPVFETKAGFHILEVLDRKGDMVNARHILLRPKPSTEELMATQKLLDSVAQLIRDSVHSMQEAVRLFSNSPSMESHYSSPYTGDIRMTTSEMEPYVFNTIDKMKVGEVSNAIPMTTEDRQQAYRLLRLKVRTSPHKANLQSDYDKIYNMALNKAKQDKMMDWLEKKTKETYIVIYGNYGKCKTKFNWKM